MRTRLSSGFLGCQQVGHSVSRVFDQILCCLHSAIVTDCEVHSFYFLLPCSVGLADAFCGSAVIIMIRYRLLQRSVSNFNSLFPVLCMSVSLISISPVIIPLSQQLESIKKHTCACTFSQFDFCKPFLHDSF